nr:uncharacterized protein LOC106688935 [Halyomorpha halys]
MSKCVVHLMEHCREADVILPEQTGFQRGVACEHHLVKLQEHTIGQMKKNWVTAFISLDCSQSFERVSNPLLLCQLEELKFLAALCRLRGSFLSGRSFAVRIGGDFSPLVSTICGVSEGSVLGPHRAPSGS